MWLIRLWSFAVYVLLVVMLVVDVTFDIVLHVGDGQTTDGQVITKISRIFLTHDAPLRGLCACWSSVRTTLKWQLSTHAQSKNRKQLIRDYL